MSKETILLVDSMFPVHARCLPAYQVGAIFLVAASIAKEGPLPTERIKKVAQLRGRQCWVDPYWEDRFFVRRDGSLSLNDEMFIVKTKGSDKYRSPLPAGVREFIHERDGYRCTYCGIGEGPFQIDHILPLAKGGSDDLENLCLSCPPCNRSKSDKLLSEWRHA